MKSLSKVMYVSKKEFPDDFLYSSTTNLSDPLGFEISPYPKSFISLQQTKEYTYMVIDDDTVLYKSSYILHIS